jgi:HSP20 family protein
MNLVTYTYPNNRVFRRLADLQGDWDQTIHATPASRSREDQDNYYVSIDLPGVRKEDVTIQVEADELKISAVRHVSGLEESINYSRTFSLPEEVAVEKIAAEQKDGVLSLTLPKKEEAKPKTVNISVN